MELRVEPIACLPHDFRRSKRGDFTTVNVMRTTNVCYDIQCIKQRVAWCAIILDLSGSSSEETRAWLVPPSVVNRHDLLSTTFRESFLRKPMGLLELMDFADDARCSMPDARCLWNWLSGHGPYYLLLYVRNPGEEPWDNYTYSDASERGKVVDSQGHELPHVSDLEKLTRGSLHGSRRSGWRQSLQDTRQHGTLIAGSARHATPENFHGQQGCP
jgi:hypothetical protein